MPVTVRLIHHSINRLGLQNMGLIGVVCNKPYALMPLRPCACANGARTVR
jgi:hypothetical protein